VSNKTIFNNKKTTQKPMKTILTLALFLSATFAFAQADKDLASQVEKLRLALIDPVEATLSELSSEKLSYGHSSGKLENQAQFIEALVSGASDFSAVAFENQTIQVEKNVAIVRHNLAAVVLDGGNSNSIKIGVILVWQKEKGQWKLLARQAYKLP
tara:strand:+ start:152 stop:619 length:468 start_codon:yes stop_codon:yes gene_type:complete